MEEKVAKVAPMPALDMMAVLMYQTGLPYSELRAMPKAVLDDLMVLKVAEVRARQEG